MRSSRPAVGREDPLPGFFAGKMHLQGGTHRGACALPTSKEILLSESRRMPLLAFIGLGAMGYPMAARLAASGYRLHVFDTAPGLAERFASEHAARAHPCAADAASAADFVITMLPSSKEVETTVLGDAMTVGVAAVLSAGATLMDMSSSEPLRTRDLATALVPRGITLIDAPVSGGVRKARDGTLAIMVGGDREAFERCEPILKAMGSTLFRTGAVGSGHAMKALNNFVSAAGLLAAVEALHIGEQFGLDPHVMTRVLNASTGRNNTTENKVEQFMLSATFDSGFALALMAKDVGIAVRLAEALDVPARLGHASETLWRQAAGRAGAADHTEMYRLLKAMRS
jgi:3-hydroxyisobutyrate dehydrogenase